MSPRDSAARSVLVLVALLGCGDGSAGDVTGEGGAARTGGGAPNVSPPGSDPAPRAPAGGPVAVDAAPAASGDLAHPDDPDGWTPLGEYLGVPVDTQRVFRDDGTLERISCHLRGERGPESLHGPEWLLFPNGLSKLRQVWVRGQLEGPFTVYWPSGMLRQEGVYRGGQRHGTFVQYFRTGDRNLEYAYVDGVPVGTWREWFVDGQPAAEENYRAGLKHGLCRRWASSGPPEGSEGTAEVVGADSILVEEAEYVDGELHGEWTDYWPATGNLRRTGRMEHDLKVGLWRANREDGSLKAEREFVAGVQEGTETLYDENGSRIAENHYVDGVQEGPQRSWFSNGQLQAEGVMRAGLREGPWTYYSPDGAVNEAWTGTYREGQRVDE